MSRYKVSENLRPQIVSLAESHYGSYQQLHQNFTQLDLVARSGIWAKTIDSQQQAQQEIERLTGNKIGGVMSMDGYQVISFPK